MNRILEKIRTYPNHIVAQFTGALGYPDQDPKDLPGHVQTTLLKRLRVRQTQLNEARRRGPARHYPEPIDFRDTHIREPRIDLCQRQIELLDRQNST